MLQKKTTTKKQTKKKQEINSSALMHKHEPQRATRRFLQVPTIYVFERYKKKYVYPYKPQFYNIKVGFKGVKII